MSDRIDHLIELIARSPSPNRRRKNRPYRSVGVLRSVLSHSRQVSLDVTRIM